jgi:hypothetical protein
VLCEKLPLTVSGFQQVMKRHTLVINQFIGTVTRQRLVTTSLPPPSLLPSRA